jgi:hypothetical protein
VDVTKLSPSEKAEYETFLEAKTKTVGDVNPQEIAYMRQLYPKLAHADSILRKELGKEEYNGNDIKDFNPVNAEAKWLKDLS